MTDPFQALLQDPGLARAVPVPYESVNMEIPEGDRDLFEQIRNNPRIADLKDEIAANRYLRVCLQRAIEARSVEAREKLIGDVVSKMQVRASINPDPSVQAQWQQVRPFVEDVVAQSIRTHFPTLDVNLNEVRAFRELLLASGKLAEQYKKITDGMVLNVKMDGRVLHSLINNVLMPTIPRKYLPALIQALEQHAPSMGLVVSQDLED